ncbi:hypothetical protein [Actinokineospora sp. NBRC 105648]|uniref:hypothetical protein n=1 Tax=Actinokineospora sp. NBRC 105648 TaxID=3032206 RepID=UPI002552251F|nr:hypothetical protein [Actinokineospora sp. NBRC 105648]
MPSPSNSATRSASNAPRPGTPPSELPAERRSHYFIDLARAQLDLGRDEDAHVSLQTARQVAPQHARAHPQVRRTLTTLLSTHSAPNSGLFDLAEWARAR